MIIQSINPNFLVNETGLRVQIDDGTIVEFYEGDGITIVNRDDVPHLEFKINDSQYAVKIETREDFESILGNLRHVSEFVIRDVELMEAFGADESDISTADFIKAYGETYKDQKNKTRINLPITKEVKNLTTQEKVAHMAHVESTFDKPLFGVLASFSEAPDPAAPGAKPANLSASLDGDEEDRKKLPSDSNANTSASGTVDTGDSQASGNKVAEGDDKDDDDEDDEKEGKKRKK